jgi:multicomponent Na+:H+ antiporter subunit E
MLGRFLLMAALWLVLTAGDPGGWLAGALASAAATVLSLRLVPQGRGTLRPWAALRLLLEFARGSLVGGVDVARRALHPRLPLHPGWVRHPLRVRPGLQRLWLGDLVSLMPGSLGAGDDGSRLLVHCLDTLQDADAALARQESQLCEAFGADALEDRND